MRSAARQLTNFGELWPQQRTRQGGFSLCPFKSSEGLFKAKLNCQVHNHILEAE